MVETTLAFASVLTYVVASVYAYVGMRLLRQARGAGESSRAMLFFALWWLATSLNQFFGSTLYLAASFGWTNVELQMTYLFVQRLLLAASLVCLMYYLVYLQSGRQALVPLLALYSLYFVLQVYILSARDPIGVQSYGWRTEVVYAQNEIRWGPATNLLIVVPPVIGALMLFRVYRRVEGPTRRFRIAMIGGGFVLWWVTAIAAGQPQAWDVSWLQAANRIAGVAIAVGVLLAYEPMLWMQRRYGLVPFSERTAT